MKRFPQRILSFLLSLFLLCSLAPSAACYQVGEPWQVDLENFLDNEENRSYVEMMLDYYLRTDEKIQKTLAEGYCAMFFFEGCSDNIDDPSLADLTFFRVTAVCIVLKLNDSGEPYITYFSPNCSTIPDRPLEYGAWSFADVGDVGPATICDGTYELYSVRHMGQYEALHMRDSYDDGELSAVYMIPEGYVTKDANSINIHTRTSNHTSGRGMWSAGCMLVGDGNYGQFLEMMDGTYYAVHDFFELDKKVGTVTINRQYLKEAMYGLYKNEDAVDMLLANSRHMLPQDYLDRCSREAEYQEPRKMMTEGQTSLMTLPCTNEADARSLAVGTLPAETELEITAQIRNIQGELWYEVQYDTQRYFVSAGAVENAAGGGWFSRFWRKLFQ